LAGRRATSRPREGLGERFAERGRARNWSSDLVKEKSMVEIIASRVRIYDVNRPTPGGTRMAGASTGLLLALTVLLGLATTGAVAETTVPAATDGNAITEPNSLVDKICPTIGREASLNELPVEFFTRLIWQESRFDPKARSHKGAEGIAQFMPGTARWRGLADSYEPLQALRESARWLGELREQFGNLGLAAAAYNAGPGRVRSWLNGQASLPAETRHYVLVITGRSAEEWRDARQDETAPALKNIPCAQIAKLFVQPPNRQRGATVRNIDPSAWGPWGLQLAGGWSEAQLLADYRKLQAKFPAILGEKRPLMLRSRAAGRGSATWYRVRVADATREGANKLCAKLEAAGGLCIVLRN
jgi:hypothetical protein